MELRGLVRKVAKKSRSEKYTDMYVSCNMYVDMHVSCNMYVDMHVSCNMYIRGDMQVSCACKRGSNITIIQYNSP